MSPGGKHWLTWTLVAITAVVLAMSIPGSLRDAWERGGIYLFSHEFLADLPRRLTGPGRFRFIMQPAIATALGIAAGLADQRTGRPPYLRALLFHGPRRGELLHSGARDTVNLVVVGVLLDALCQWFILGVSHPGAALIVGPVLVTGPYALARALANRCASARNRGKRAEG